MAAYVLDRCDCPHEDAPEMKPATAIEEQLAGERRTFLNSTRDRLPAPDGWDVREMDDVRDESDEIDHQED
jgi:hypothetical protein